MIKRTPLLAAAVIVLLFLVTPLTAGLYEIRPGGTYTITLTVKKPSYVRLTEGNWEVRVYFYKGNDCYNTGTWWQSGGDWIYSGWYAHRFTGDDWTDTSEERLINIPATIVSYPRPTVDVGHGMREIPVGTAVTMRIRLLIKNINPIFSGDVDAESGFVSFTIGNTYFQYSYTQDQYGDYNLQAEGFEASIDMDSTGEYRLLVDMNMSSPVSEQALPSDVFIIPEPLELALSSSSKPEPAFELPTEIKLIGGGMVLVVVVGVVMYMGLRKRGEKELFPME